jgi:tetratricopeptide (TPR) repeat protein
MASTTTFRANPYVIGTPIKDQTRFFGREDLFNFVRQMLHSQAKVILLHGQRRIGKSSVLAQIPCQVGNENFTFVSFDLQGETGRPLDQILFDLTTKIAASWPGFEIPPRAAMEKSDTEQGAFARVVLPSVQGLLRRNRLVLLLDEFDVLGDRANSGEVDPFFRYLSNVVTEHDSVQVIAVIGRRLDDLVAMQSLFHNSPSQTVGLLDRRATTQLIRKPAEGVLTFDDDAVDAILDLSAGHPYFTQLLAYVLFQRAQDDGLSRVGKGDVDAAIAKALESGEAGLEWFRSGLDVSARVMFSVIAELQERQKGPPSPQTFWAGVEEVLREVGALRTEALVSAVKRLVEWDFVQEDPGGGYRVKIELVRRWLVAQHPLRHVIRELEQSDAKAAEAYKQAQEAGSRGDAGSAMALYEQALAANPNHFSALIELAEMRLKAGDYMVAVPLYERAYKVDPSPMNAENFVAALVGAGSQLKRQKSFEQAAAMAQTALQVEPDNEEATRLFSEADAAARRALAARNPFVVGGPVPPDHFVGRSTEVSQVFQTVLKGGNIALYGERGMGKSSLLDYFRSPLSWERNGLSQAPFVFVAVDCLALAPFSPKQLWGYVARAIERQFGADSQIAAAAAQLRTSQEALDLSGIVQALGAQGRKLVLLLNEFEAALAVRADYSQREVQYFLAQLRGLLHEATTSLSIVLATAKSPVDLAPSLPSGSPWYNQYVFVRLKPFDDSEVAELAGQMPARLAPDPSVMRWARLISGDWPYLLQAAFSAYFSVRSQDRSFAIGDATAEVAGRAETIFPPVWENCSEQEQMLLTLLALRDWERRTGASQPVFQAYDLVLSQYEQNLEDMQKRGLVMSNLRDRYVLRSSLMGWWIIKQIESLRQDEVTKRSLVFFQFLNRRRATELQGGLMQIWEQAKRWLESLGRTGRFQTGIRQVREQKAAFRDVEKWARPLPEEAA